MFRRIRYKRKLVFCALVFLGGGIFYSGVYQINSKTTPMTSPELKDWNDYSRMQMDLTRTGPGEQGKPLYLYFSREQKEIADKRFRQYKYNISVSDRISLDRAIPDTRPLECVGRKYLNDLPLNSVNIIIPFHNERNTTLLRTVHSVINRTPGVLLKEVILVDDSSTHEELTKALDDYLKQPKFRKVRIIRFRERLGLIRARTAGADNSSGSILVFIDSHIEVNANYLPPLIEPIVVQYKTIVCPEIDGISGHTFEIRRKEYGERFMFDWSMRFIRQSLGPFDLKDVTKPYPVPVIVGCAFAISRQWWEEIGKFDPGLDIWGGEQLEIAFKSWQCGGRVLIARCSKVAHLNRPLPYVADLVERNLLRVASVWMDEYKEYVFQRRPNMKNINPGDLTSQFAVRKRLNCKSFHWYLTKIAPDLLSYFPVNEPPMKAQGFLKRANNSTLCMKVLQISEDRNVLRFGYCYEGEMFYFYFNFRNQIMWSHGSLDTCLTNVQDRLISATKCILQLLNMTQQQFEWNPIDGHIVNLRTRLCLDATESTGEVFMEKCMPEKSSQKWTFVSRPAGIASELKEY